MLDDMKEEIVILGSTGSIGRQSIEVAEALGLGVAALTGGRNVALMEEQARRVRPRFVAMASEQAAADLRVRLSDLPLTVAGGEAALEAAAELSGAKTVITAISGAAGLRPTLAAIAAGKRIALANKETLVCAGALVMERVREMGTELIPVDSEHSAIFQSLRGGEKGEVRRILLTCSGGPFRGWDRERLEKVTAKEALRHPNWSMGPKITVDSATLMNKGLEVIEAMHLFSLRPEQIRVLVHPQSIVHSAVEFCDNAVIAQMGLPSMKLPIEFALTWPKRSVPVAPPLDLVSVGSISFEEPDREAFPCLALAESLAGRRGNYAAVMNAANEAAVGLFLEGKIGFLQIHACCRDAVEHLGGPAESLEELLEADRAARRFVLERH